MKVNMNKDFELAFQDEFIAGFSLRQCVTAGIGIVVSTFAAVLTWKVTGFSIVECTYIGIPMMIPILITGFYRYQKQTPWKLWKEYLYMKKTKLMIYEANEKEKTEPRIFSMSRKKKEG